MLQKQEHPAEIEKGLAAKNASNLNDEDEQDNFAALKAQAWGRMVPGQIGQHLSELREQAEKLRLPEAASPSLAIRVLHYHCDHLGTPRELTDESGKPVWSAEYMAWGKLKSNACRGAQADQRMRLATHRPISSGTRALSRAGPTICRNGWQITRAMCASGGRRRRRSSQCKATQPTSRMSGAS